MMDVELVTHLNTLWNPIYPHLAQWIEQWIPQNTGQVLEIGPFSGGIFNGVFFEAFAKTTMKRPRPTWRNWPTHFA